MRVSKARIILSGCLVNCEFLKVFDLTELEKISAIYHLSESNGSNLFDRLHLWSAPSADLFYAQNLIWMTAISLS
jgi:hypothetical protein